MSETKTSLEPTVGMTLLDAVPVIFFAASMTFVAMFFSAKSLAAGWIFGTGAFLSFLAGFGKVIWKLLLAVAKKDIQVFKKHFRVLMSSGFVFMLIPSVYYIKKFGSAAGAGKIFSSIPGIICLLIGLGSFIAMCVYGAKADMDTAKANWTEEILNSVAQIFIFIFVIVSLFNLSYFSYSPDPVCDEILESASGPVNITKKINYIFLDGEGNENLLVFYPGGLVNNKAYVPFMKKFAEAGFDVVLLRAPSDLIIYKTKAAKPVLKKYAGKYDKVFLGGHSLGGAAASMYAPEAIKNFPNVKGLLLCGSYSMNQFDSDFSIVSVKGEGDGVLRMNKYLEYMGKLSDFSELTIPGGNHANFGHYGFQKGDNASSISADQQQELTVKFALENLIN